MYTVFTFEYIRRYGYSFVFRYRYSNTLLYITFCLHNCIKVCIKVTWSTNDIKCHQSFASGNFFPMWETCFILNTFNRTSFVFGFRYSIVFRSRYVFSYQYVFKSKYIFRFTYSCVFKNRYAFKFKYVFKTGHFPRPGITVCSQP